MAVNEKPIYAAKHTTFDGKYFNPGDRIDGRMADYAIRSALENGVATDVARTAEQAKDRERGRLEMVAQMQASRSERREHNERRAGNIPQLVRMPDGSLREVTH